MKTYLVKIEFESDKHCFECPLCDEFDACILQNNKDFNTVAQQMKKCPLIFKGEQDV